MFDIGFFEMLLIAIVALLVIGPERLPRVAHTCGKWLGQARRMTRELSNSLDRELENQELQKELLKQVEEPKMELEVGAEKKRA